MNDLTPSGVAAPARVLVVEPVSSGSRVVRDAHELGFAVTVVSADEGERTLSAELRELVDTLLIVDTNDERALTECVLNHHASAPLAAIVPGGEFTIPAVTRINSGLGLPGLPSAAVDWVRNKASMRTRVADAGLRVPRSALAGTPAEVEAAAAVVGFPCVLKPVESSGSIHVSRADSLDELRSAYRELIADRRLDPGIALDSRVLLEEYVAGPEFSADGYVHEGRATILSLTRKLLSPEPYFVELGHVVPSSVPEEVTARVTEYVAGVVDAAGRTQPRAAGPAPGPGLRVDAQPVDARSASALGGAAGRPGAPGGRGLPGGPAHRRGRATRPAGAAFAGVRAGARGAADDLRGERGRGQAGGAPAAAAAAAAGAGPGRGRSPHARAGVGRAAVRPGAGTAAAGGDRPGHGARGVLAAGGGAQPGLRRLVVRTPAGLARAADADADIDADARADTGAGTRARFGESGRSGAVVR